VAINHPAAQDTMLRSRLDDDPVMVVPLRPNNSDWNTFLEASRPPSINQPRLPGLTLGEGAGGALKRGAGQRSLAICLHRTDAQ